MTERDRPAIHSISALCRGQEDGSPVREGLVFTDRVSAALRPEETDTVKGAPIPATPSGFPARPCNIYRVAASKVGRNPLTICLRPVAKALRQLLEEVN